MIGISPFKRAVIGYDFIRRSFVGQNKQPILPTIYNYDENPFTMITRDLLWKGIIEDLFDDFLFFFFSLLAKEVDFSRPFEFLDKDLKKIYPTNDLINRYADKLVKVFLISGQEIWVLIHIEVQGYNDQFFGKRMFTMFYRLFDRFKVEINQIAIFTDDSPTYHPKGFSLKNYGTWLDYGFKTWKLLDNPPETYVDKTNLFAIAMEVAWQGLKMNKKGDEHTFSFKINLVKKLRAQNVERSKISSLINFIEFYVSFDNPEFNHKFENEIHQNSQDMGLEALIKEAFVAEGIELGIKQGEEKGFEKGEQVGMEKGMEKGMEIKEKTTIIKMLKKGFKPKRIAYILEIDLPIVLKVQKSWKAEQKKTKK